MSKGIEVTKDNPCAHCGKPDFCYRLEPISVCNRDHPPAPGWYKTSKTDKEGHYYYAPINGKKSPRPQQKRVWEYPDRDGNPLVRVIRIDDGQGGKPKRWQESWNGEKWVKGLKGVKREDIPIYRYKEVKEAIALGETIFIVEGEPAADALWKLELPATTNLGGSGKWKPSDTQDLEGASVILCPDRDKPGVAHMDIINKDFPDAQWLYAFPDSPLWNKLANGGGLDVVDWIDEFKIKDKKHILESVEEKRSFNEVADKTTQQNDEDSEKINKLVNLLLEKNQSDSQRQAFIADQLGTSAVTTVEKIYQQRLKEIDLDEHHFDLVKSFPNIIKQRNTSLALKEILPPKLALIVSETADSMPVAREALFTALLPVISTAVGNTFNLLVSARTDWVSPAIIRTIIVAKSGDAKSPILRKAIKGLSNIDKDNYKIYEQQLNLYNQLSKEEKAQTPPPKRSQFIAKNVNTTGIIRLLNENSDKGLINVVDEASGYFNRQNQYTKGIGDDAEIDLELFGGDTLYKDRGSESIYIESPRLNIAGTTQWNMLTQLFEKYGGENDARGTFARWLFCAVDMPPMYLQDDDDIRDERLTNEIEAFIKYMQTQVQSDLRLTPFAFKVFQRWQHSMVERKKTESNPTMLVAIPKFIEYCTRFSLILHPLWCFYNEEDRYLERVIDENTVNRAIVITQWFIDQLDYVLTRCSDPNEKTEAKLIELKELLWKYPDGLSTRECQRKRKAIFGKDNKKQISDLFDVLIESGFAQDISQGKSRKIKPFCTDAEIEVNEVPINPELTKKEPDTSNNEANNKVSLDDRVHVRFNYGSGKGFEGIYNAFTNEIDCGATGIFAADRASDIEVISNF